MLPFVSPVYFAIIQEMLNIKFYIDHDDKDLKEAANEYQRIWDEEGRRIVRAIEKISGLKIKEKVINAIVFEGISYSRPLSLRASYPTDIKKGTLVHELCHRLMSGNFPQRKVIIKDYEAWSLKNHKNINLVLYDIWVDLYGKEVADRNVEVESGRKPLYKKAWDWALVLSKEEREKKFSEVKTNKD